MAKITIKINHFQFEKILYEDDMKVVTAAKALEILAAAAEIFNADRKLPNHVLYLKGFETEVRGKSVWIGNTSPHAFWVEFGTYLAIHGWAPEDKRLGYAPLRRGLDVVASNF